MKFDYLEPKTIEEAVFLLGKYDGKAKVIAGGTDLLVQIRDKAMKPECVVDITGISGLDYIKYDAKQGLSIGALTPVRAVERSAEIQQRYRVIFQAASQLGSVAIRNMATIGGNLCNAAPSADTAPALIGLSAVAKIVGADGHREVPLEDFFTGPSNTVLKNGELLAEIQVPVPLPNTSGVYLKHAIRAVDLPIVGVAVIITLGLGEVCKDVKIVLGAVAPTPMRARNAEEILRGKQMDEALIEKSAQVASDESRPISDVRASAEYRQEMVKVYTKQAIKEAMAK